MAILDDLIGRSPPIVALREQVARVLARQTETARRSPPILLLGETGTGKGLIAASIQRAGARARGPFIDVNCAAIPETLLEAELFGWERGAFTDARQPKPGLFQLANGGTIFLDEVGLLLPSLQSKLLKVIEEQQVRRLGGTRNEAVDVWVIAATSEDLAEAMRTRRFREDLYHRLAVLTLRLPPLRERAEDIAPLAEHFLARACADYGLPPKTLTADASRALIAYTWPGNVRELANVIERAMVVSKGSTILPENLPPHLFETRPVTTGDTPLMPDLSLEAAEREQILRALQASGGKRVEAARRLGLSRRTLYRKLDRYGIA